MDAEETSDLSECSDDALEEVVLAGMKTRGDQFSEDLGLSEAAARAHLDGLAETCNLELLRRVAPSLSTAPVPRAQRTDRGKALSTPLQRFSSPTPLFNDKLAFLQRPTWTSPPPHRRGCRRSARRPPGRQR